MLTNQIKRAVVVAVIAAPGLALAGEPTVQAQSLATVEAILQYCAKVVPAAAEQFDAQAKGMSDGVDQESLARLRAGEQYRAAYDSTLESISKVGKEDVEKACAQHVAQFQ